MAPSGTNLGLRARPSACAAGVRLTAVAAPEKPIFFDTFAVVDATTHGGPGKATAILVYKVYYDGFKALDMGGSAAQSVVLMAIVIVLTVAQFRYVEKKVQY